MNNGNTEQSNSLCSSLGSSLGNSLGNFLGNSLGVVSHILRLSLREVYMIFRQERMAEMCPKVSAKDHAEVAVVLILNAIPKLPEVLQEFVDGSTQLVCSVGEFAHSFTRLVEEAIQKIDSLKHIAIDYDFKARSILEDSTLEILCRAIRYLDSINKLLSYGKDESKKEHMKETLKRGDLEPLRQYLGLLQRSMTQVRQHYDNFEEACKKAKGNCEAAAKDCEHKSREARSKKRATRVIGGMASATAIAGGVGTGVALSGAALSIAAGVFTFGVGTVVGLGITAVASAAAGPIVGAGAAVATHFIASDFKATEEKFAELARVFKSMCSIGSRTLMHVSILSSRLESLAEVMDDVKYCSEHCLQSISCALDLLFEKLTDSSAKVDACIEQLNSKWSEVEQLKSNRENTERTECL